MLKIMNRYIYGWKCWLEGLRKARAKKHGAGKQRWSHALKTAACYRFLVDGQFRNPPRFPRYLNLIFIAFMLTGCATLQGVQNPINNSQLSYVENSYGIALSAAVAYRHLPLCKRSTPFSVGNVCAKRSVIVQMQIADRKVQIALRSARGFIRDNPTIDASSFISIAQNAVFTLQQIEAENGVAR